MALDGLRRLREDTTIYNGDSTITADIFGRSIPSLIFALAQHQPAVL
jgi:hypothetical protein